ncbi:hypothetical protein GN958_ATG05489 [Phytophthora infestans]|uniref:Uncharacterized protein n=1 Tax=Phytophthora infestans TaxID=4787 RepID=A0A8S9UXA4_PHYIN|nr:hypothetical protein GN958_ATG05489 [Phytophthora infestans]
MESERTDEISLCVIHEEAEREGSQLIGNTRITRHVAVASFNLDIKLRVTDNNKEQLLRIQVVMQTLNNSCIELGDKRRRLAARNVSGVAGDWKICFSERRLKPTTCVKHITRTDLSASTARAALATQRRCGMRCTLSTFDIYNRYLAPIEKVATNISSVLCENGETTEDQDLADVILSNAVKLRDVAERLEISKLISNNVTAVGCCGINQRIGDQQVLADVLGGGTDMEAIISLVFRLRAQCRVVYGKD